MISDWEIAAAVISLMISVVGFLVACCLDGKDYDVYSNRH